MELIGIIAVVVVVLLIVFFLVSMMFGTHTTDRATIVAGSYPGSRRIQDNSILPPSYNQAEGRVYSYTGWILVKDFTTGYGFRRQILSRPGDSPGIYLDGTSNSLIFAIKTYGTTETILIPNIPAMKWIHFGLVVDQQAVSIYINGMLRKHHTLGQLPDLVDGPTSLGPKVVSPPWNGVVGRVEYYAYAVPPSKMKELASETPPDDLAIKPSGPQYFDISWYIGRLNSM